MSSEQQSTSRFFTTVTPEASTSTRNALDLAGCKRRCGSAIPVAKRQRTSLQKWRYNPDDAMPASDSRHRKAGPLPENTSACKDRFSSPKNLSQPLEGRHVDAKGMPDKHTPLEKQVLQLKKQHPGVLLLFEVGYKYIFYGEDATIASSRLSIVQFWNRTMNTAMVPAYRLYTYIKRLLQEGYKVGIVRQKETAAVKRDGGTRYGLFKRELTELYTLGTFIESMNSEEDENNPVGGCVLFLRAEEQEHKKGIDSSLSISLAAIEPEQGDLWLDYFNDTYILTELDCRLRQLRPTEIWLARDICATVKAAVRLYQSNHLCRLDFFEPCRHEEGLAYVSGHLSQENAPPDEYLSVAPRKAIQVLADLCLHLQAFGLAQLCRRSAIKPFAQNSCMTLGAATLQSLSVFEGNPPHSTHTLFSLLDHCYTLFGRRLLKKWLGRPLTNLPMLQERQAGVQEIVEARSQHAVINQLRELLANLPDLERGLSRLRIGRIHAAELIRLFLAFQEIGQLQANRTTCRSQGLRLALESCSSVLAPTRAILSKLQTDSAAKDDLQNIFLPGIHNEVDCLKDQRKSVDDEIRSALHSIRLTLMRPTLSFTTVADEEYLIELPSSQTVPTGWLKINSTKTHSRYRPPEIHGLMQKRQRLSELLQSALEAYKVFLVDLVKGMHFFEEAVRRLAEADCLFSLATYSSATASCRPIFSDQPGMQAVNARHALIDAFLSKPCVGNTIDLKDEKRTMILASANMSGKSTYSRTVATIAVLAQIGCYVPAEACTMGIFDGIYMRMGAVDRITASRSTFLVELTETSDILAHATSRSLVIIDELGRGSSTRDGEALAFAVLQHLTRQRCPFAVFTTHYFRLLQYHFPRARVHHFAIAECSSDGMTDIEFLYKLEGGPASESGGVNAARLACLPASVISRAAEIAKRQTNSLRAQLATDILQGRSPSTRTAKTLLRHLGA